MSDRVVFEFEKNAKERVRATLGEFKGREVASLRVWYDADENGPDGEPIFRPSKKGITIARRNLPALLEAVRALVDEAGEAA